ncbi:hypothetical protein [uncultured Thiodictyon sp.]|jgi:hypothetical protein|uniref:hypothetical protein n=1 Tax=uncultured Thiodictyon sp. TaxID=1846217 RepID=UPI0025FE870C|nr:hypothetical protein [uncultured Thiodictyon sp.]
MGAVKGGEALGNPDRLVARYGGVPVIYVESDEDHYVFGECWFKDRLSRVEFQPAASQCGFAGCSAVIQAVGDERAAGNPAWGIVDRDVVMSLNLWHLVHETDDTRYEQAKPFGAEVKVLRLWEMESYLADARALEQCRSELSRQSPRPVAAVDEELLNHCQALVPHAAMNAACHEIRVGGLPDGMTDRFPSRAAVERNIETTILPTKPEQVATMYRKHLPLVDAFDLVGATPKDRVSRLLRRVAGKAVLKRFSASHHINVDLKGLLANRIKEQNRVPDEITRFVEEIASV